MDENLRRVFDQTCPSSEQKEAMLDRLLEPERKDKPMKRLKKLTVVAIAAALMLVTCAAAVVTGLDQRILDYFGAGSEQAELLAPGVVPVDITVEDNGAVFHVTQALMDRYSLVVLADFTAPEGTVLDMGYSPRWGIVYFDGNYKIPYLLDKNEELVDVNSSCTYGWKILEDDDPKDNHLSMLFRLSVSAAGALNQEGVTSIWLEAKDLIAYDLEAKTHITVYKGNWSVQIPLPEEDIGRFQPVDCEGIKEIYLSPMTLHMTLNRKIAWHMRDEDTCGITLTDRDGNLIPMTMAFGDSGNSVVTDLADENYQLEEIVDLNRLQGGKLTLRIGDGNVDIPLDGLVPAGGMK